VVANVRKRLAASKQAAHNSEAERFNLGKINGFEVRKGNWIKVTNRFASLENLHDNEDINRSWENIKENIIFSAKESLGLYELKQYKTRLDEECLRFLDQGKQTKMQWLQDPNQINVNSLNNVRYKEMSES
jgi:CTP-dependent riboflavin kinase